MADQPSFDDLIRDADAKYRPLPQFVAWSKAVVDLSRWNAAEIAHRELADEASDLLPKALEVARKAAAIDTGALEGLYELERGFTITVATQSAMWQAAFEKKSEVAQRLIKSQLGVYDEVLDFATKKSPMVQAWVRNLHELLCEHQATYNVITANGVEERPLPRGQYKQHPNHVRQPDGALHSYAPVAMVEAEMTRFCDELKGSAFGTAHPVLQAAYAHYGIAAIHPFADGNGRVARALGSVYMCRATSIPLTILVGHRDSYLDALAAADDGQVETFIEFVARRGIEGFAMVAESVRAARKPNATEVAASIRRLHLTRGGYRHSEVDAAGLGLLGLLHEEVRAIISELPKDTFSSFATGYQNVGKFPAPPAGYRVPVTTAQNDLQIQLAIQPPAAATLAEHLVYYVPSDCDVDGELLIVVRATGERFGASISEVIPDVSPALQLRARMFAQGIVGGLAEKARQIGENALRGQGY